MHIALILLSLIWLLVAIVVVAVCLMAARADKRPRHAETSLEVSLAGSLRTGDVRERPPAGRREPAAHAVGSQTVGRRRRRDRRSHADLGAN